MMQSSTCAIFVYCIVPCALLDEMNCTRSPQVKPEEYQPRLLWVRKCKSSMRVMEVEKVAASRRLFRRRTRLGRVLRK